MDRDAHPVADLFPMLTNDELQDLAADIKERGQLHAIVLDVDGRVLDGRNRLAACRLAGVEPRFETYDGDDPDGYALAVNVQRRHMSKGQAAMVTAQAAVFSENTMRALGKTTGVSASRLAYASTVIQHAPGLAPLVVTGVKSLNEAYREAQQRKNAASTDEAKMERLQAEDPDLAALVKEERLSLDNAIRQLAENQQRHRDEVKLISNQVHDTIDYCLTSLGTEDFRKHYASMYDPSSVTYVKNEIDAKAIKAAGNALLALAKEWPT